MKKTRFLFLALLFGTFVSAYAQEKAHRLVFVDARGQVFSDNATVTFHKLEEDDFGRQVIKAPILVRNTHSEALFGLLKGQVKEQQDGYLQVCFLEECNPWPAVGDYLTSGGKIEPGAGKDSPLDIEFIATGSGRSVVTLQLFTAKEQGGDWKPQQPNASITLVFDPNATSIRSVASHENVFYNVFTLQGQTVGRRLPSLQGLPKGTYIVQKARNSGPIDTYKHLVP